ncbi:MAG TPA: diguanylate cyclase, partial [Burkholderiales bacterium]|nr:diguanylate cyclase [Burkholderiales bacterium]
MTTPGKDIPEPGFRKNDPDRRKNANTLPEAAIASREKTATIREKAADSRENAAHLRESTADLREDAAHIRESEASDREGAASIREQDIRMTEAVQASFDNKMLMLQQANENLVIASIEAQKLTEQVQMAKADLDHLAHHDPLTHLPNRIMLHDRLNQAIEMARRQVRQIAVMFLDLDHFKYINDSLGHATGDRLLQSVAQRVSATVRHSDTVARQGGDEFIILLAEVKHAEDAALSAQKILTALLPPHLIDGHSLHIGVSIGISVFPADGQDVDTLIKNADIAMYNVKENGRNHYKFFEPVMNARSVQRQSVEASLRLALERQEFILYYQPKINLHSGIIVGVEALIRWQHPKLGLLLPAEFVRIAEDSGLILPIGRWVLRQACLQASLWRQAGLSPITIAVNTSALEFRAEDFVEFIGHTLTEMGLEPGLLELELTESVLMRDVESTDSVLQALAELGVKLAVDDFGTGYSSLSYLRQFPIDTLKIDQSF